MVSFQCDACTDVVKKPKLDRHYGQCRSSFTCIDCSATFAGPEKWKVHTSCITEAEKYQKSLYNGPKKERGSRSYNGHHNNSQLKATNAPGKYHQSYSNQSSWSHRPYIRNWASGANSTPLGSPLRMSPVDPPPAEPSPSSANAAKTEHGEGKKRDSGAVMENHALNGAEPKKRETKHDPTGRQQHVGKDAAADEPISLAGSSEKHKKDEKSGGNSQSKAQPPTEGILEKSGDKKVKKRKREKRDVQPKQGDLTEEAVARPEPVITHADNDSKDDKKSKKRKRKEKRNAQVNEGSTVVEEVATQPEPLASQTDDAKGKKKTKKSKEEKAGLEGRLVTTVDVITQDQATGDKRKDEGSVGNDSEKKRKRKRDQSTGYQT
ncbi:hypothetical protein BJV74DRAFT_89646 [Russula compacta]|nr:hypothetical protein BJV74DRAFT_89646 [Russula compacta]